jgi:hypothetical protein
MPSLSRGNRAAHFCHRFRNLLPVRQLRVLLARGTTDGERGADAQPDERSIVNRTLLEPTAAAESSWLVYRPGFQFRMTVIGDIRPADDGRKQEAADPSGESM